ncbi:MAG: peptidylprolyl isomerase [Oceanicaulis sp.]
MSRSFAIALTACVSGLALSVSACADSESEAGAEIASAETQAAGTQAAPAEAAGETVQDAPAEPDGPSAAEQAIENAPESAWRTVDPENLLKITADEGVIWVELADSFAPAHTARMRELARMDWFDYKVWHRVIDGFMAQGGGALDNPAIDAPTPPLQAEFTIRRDPAEIEVSELGDRVVNPRSDRSRAQAGFYNGFPAGTQPGAAAGIMGDGRVSSWLIHCDGAAAMARTGDPNSANAQFYIVRGDAEHLNAQYTVWGKVREGLDVVYALNEGTMGENFNFRPSFIRDLEVASDLPEDERVRIEVMDTGSQAFANYLDALRGEDGALPDICSIDVPVRVSE